MPDNRSTAVHSSASRFRRSRQWLIAVATVAVLAAWGGVAADSSSSSQQSSRPTAAEVHLLDTVHNEQVAANVRMLAATEWYDEAERQEAERFFAAAAAAEVEQAAQAVAAANAKKKPAAPTGRGGSSGGGGSSVGGACGGATNGADAFIGRESGGNPNARNASGAWGCYQIMPGTWASSCSDLGQHGSASTQAQAQCASRLPSSAWAASGG